MGIDLHRVAPGMQPHLANLPTTETIHAPGGRKACRRQTKLLTSELSDLQQLLWAHGKDRLLVVLQGIDAAGKGGVIRHVFWRANPAGVKVSSFNMPTQAELARDYLWRVHAHVPAAGEIGIFDRSHYEDVLAAQVMCGMSNDRIEQRLNHIRNFEQMLVEEGTTIVKLFLHISKDEQKKRLEKRLNNPHKQYKFRVNDLDTRDRWDEYQVAFENTIAATSTNDAPWYVIPSDRKWYRNWACSTIIVQTLQNMGLVWPQLGDRDPRFYKAVEEGRILHTDSDLRLAE